MIPYNGQNPPDSSPSNFTPRQYTPTAITATFPPMVTIVGSNFIQGQALRASNFTTFAGTGMYQLNNNVYYVQEPTADTFVLADVYGYPIDATIFTPFVNNGLAQFTLTGPNLFVDNPAPPPPPVFPPWPPQ